MGLKAGALLWNRQQITVLPGQGLPANLIDTGLAQVNKNFADQSVGEPAINAAGTIGSRIQVLPLAPLSAWTGITHGEPFLDTDGKIKVQFDNVGQTQVLNVLFWNPHSIVGPGDADLYTIGGGPT